MKVPVTQVCSCAGEPGWHVEEMGSAFGVEVPVHWALVKTFRVPAVALLQLRLAHKLLLPLPTKVHPAV